MVRTRGRAQCNNFLQVHALAHTPPEATPTLDPFPEYIERAMGQTVPQSTAASLNCKAKNWIIGLGR